MKLRRRELMVVKAGNHFCTLHQAIPFLSLSLSSTQRRQRPQRMQWKKKRMRRLKRKHRKMRQ
ncbi:unnamed protein product [Brassica oleracea var. botrytis]